MGAGIALIEYRILQRERITWGSSMGLPRRFRPFSGSAGWFQDLDTQIRSSVFFINSISKLHIPE